MFRDIIYSLIIIMIFAFVYVGNLAVQKQAYVVYGPLFVDSFARAQKSAKDLQAYPAVKSLHDEIFMKQQREFSLKIVNGLIELNRSLNLGGDFKKALDKYKSSSNPDQDYLLLREFQESVKLLPPPKWIIPKRFYYFAATSICVSYDELKSLDGLKWGFIQKAVPLEPILQSQREQDASNYCIQKNAVLAQKKIFDDWQQHCSVLVNRNSPACMEGLNNLKSQWDQLQKVNAASEDKLKTRWQDWRLPACAN
jgi:hypothetical protein